MIDDDDDDDALGATHPIAKLVPDSTVVSTTPAVAPAAIELFVLVSHLYKSEFDASTQMTRPTRPSRLSYGTVVAHSSFSCKHRRWRRRLAAYWGVRRLLSFVSQTRT